MVVLLDSKNEGMRSDSRAFSWCGERSPFDGLYAPSAVSLTIPVFKCDVPPAATPVALNAPCRHGLTGFYASR